MGRHYVSKSAGRNTGLGHQTAGAHVRLSYDTFDRPYQSVEFSTEARGSRALGYQLWYR